MLDYSIKDIEDAAGGQVALSDDKSQVIMGRMRYPSLSLHGIEGAFSAPGAKTVIPAKVGYFRKASRLPIDDFGAMNL